MNLMTIYDRMPIFMQNIMTTGQGIIYKIKRYKKSYYLALQEYLERDYTDEEMLIKEQWDRASELIRYAYNNSPFYREFYKDVDIEKVIENRDIEALPILKKETVRENLPQMYTIPEKKAHKSYTSGTTGKSMKFLWFHEDFQRRLAYLDAFKIKSGFMPMKMKSARFNASRIVPPNQKKKIFWRDNLAIKQRIYSAYWCNSKNVKYYVDDLNKYKPKALDGYPSAIYEIANYILQNNVQLTFTPVAIFPTAETLYPHHREVIEKAFKCPVYDQYASSEGAPFITECTCGKLHYCVDTGIIEFCKDGRMLVTCFETHGTPLIRYDIGDNAYLSSYKKCSCGSALPVVERIEGRNMDYLLSPKNGKFPAIHMSIVKEGFNNSIKAMQFVQNEYTAIDVYIEIDEQRYNSEMNLLIEEELHYSLGEEMDIRIHVVDNIPKDKSGKFRMVINNLK